MKSKNILIGLALGLGLLSQSIAFAQNGPANGRGAANRPDTAGSGTANTECPYLVDGSCPGGAGLWQGTGECPMLNEGVCPNGNVCGEGTCQSPDGQPKLDGTGGPGKPANPAGPQDGSGSSAPRGRGNRGGRG